MAASRLREQYPEADFYADLEDENTLPEERFDCIIATQVLMYMYDIKQVMLSLKKLLKPGGALIITVPGFANHRRGANAMLATYTEGFLKRLCMETFGNFEDFQYYGNAEYITYMLFGMKKNPYKKPSLNKYAYSAVLGILVKKENENAVSE